MNYVIRMEKSKKRWQATVEDRFGKWTASAKTEKKAVTRLFKALDLAFETYQDTEKNNA